MATLFETLKPLSSVEGTLFEVSQNITGTYPVLAPVDTFTVDITDDKISANLDIITLSADMTIESVSADLQDDVYEADFVDTILDGELLCQ